MNMKILSVFMVAISLSACVIPLAGDGSAVEQSVGDGGSYSYTLTYDSSQMTQTNTTSANTQLSLDGMDAIYLPSYDGTTVSGYGSWTWDSTTGLGPFNSFYQAFDKADGNAMVCRLDPFDLTKSISGVSIAGYGFNVMWVLPTVYWSSTPTTLTLSNDPTAGTAYAHTIDGHTYNYIAIGVYEGSTATVNGSTVLTSTSGTTPTASQTRATFRGYANSYTMDSTLDSGTTYTAKSMLWNFYQWELYKYCAYMVMENFNSQNTVGNGHVYGSTYAFTTGETDTSGPYAGNPGVITNAATGTSYGSSQVKLFIEGQWGGLTEFADGCTYEGSTIYIESSSVPTDATTSGTYVTSINLSLTSGYPSQIYTDSSVWGLGAESSGSGSMGVSDYVSINTTSSMVIKVGGASNTYATRSVRQGLAYVNAFSDLSFSHSNTGSRLAFVFDVDSTSNNAVSVTSSNTSYGAVSVAAVTGEFGDSYTVSGTTIDINGTSVTASATATGVQETFTFDGWYIGASQASSSGTLSSIKVTARFSYTPQTYDISFAVNDATYGSVSRATVSAVPYGSTFALSGNTLTVNGTTVTVSLTASDAQYTYSLGSWSVSDGDAVDTTTFPSMAIGDTLAVTANLTRTLNTYTVTIDDDSTGYGSVDTATVADVPYGATLTASGTTLAVSSPSTTVTASVTASDTVQYDYGFGNWTVSSSAVTTYTVTGNVTVVANFTRDLQTYTVSFAPSTAGYGSVTPATASSVPYGSAFTVSSNTITIGGTTVTAQAEDPTDMYTYAFDSWSASTGDAIDTTTYPSLAIGDTILITANFTRTSVTYVVTFQDDSSGYGTLTTVTPSLDYGTVLTVSGNTISYDSTTLTATIGTDTVQYDYGFDSWTANGTSITSTYTVTSQVTIQANFTRDLQTYTVSFVLNDASYGTISPSTVSSVPYGSAFTIASNVATINGSPVTAGPAAQTAQYTYTFGSWSVDDGDMLDTATFPSMAIGDTLTVTATIDRTVNTYTVTVTTNDATYGEVSPSTIASVPYGSTFAVSDDTFTINGTTASVTLTASDAQYTYTFGSWSIDDGDMLDTTTFPNMSVGDTLQVTATIDRTLNAYTVTVTAGSGGAVDTQSISSVPYGSAFAVSNDTFTINGTTVTASANTGYSFSAWSVSNGDTVTGDTAVSASFTINTYTVTIVSDGTGYGDVDTYTVTSVPYGATLTANDTVLTVSDPDTAVNASATTNTVQYVYGFAGWTIDGSAVTTHTMTGDIIVVANFTQGLQTYNVIFASNDDDYGYISPNIIASVPYGSSFTVSGESVTANGSTVTAYPEASDAQYTYSFSSWDISNGDALDTTTFPSLTLGDTSVTVEATFTYTVNTYTVTVTANNADYGTVSPSTISQVPYGTSIAVSDATMTINGTTVTATPAEASGDSTYYFSSWSVADGDTITGTTTITATFGQIVPTFTLTFAAANEYGSVDVASIADVDSGTVITIDGDTITVNGTTVTATPIDSNDLMNYTFTGWRSNGETVTGEVEASADQTFTAMFERHVGGTTRTILDNLPIFAVIGVLLSAVGIMAVQFRRNRSQ